MRGYSLVEVLVAVAIVAAAVAGLPPLVAMSARANMQSKQTTIAAILAQQKMEQMVVGGGLTQSPADALADDIEGYAEFFDRAGAVLRGGSTPPAGSAYVRRWSVEPLTETANGSWLLQVVVIDLRSRGVARIVAARSRQQS